MSDDLDLGRLMKAGADSLFPGLLSQDQMQDIHERRKRKVEKARKKGIKIRTTSLDVHSGEYVIKDGGFDRLEDGSIVATEDFDVRRYMNDMEDEETGTLHDLKIDLRDLPLAKNFYDYCFNLSGKKMHAPWSRQMWIGAMTFGEICPCCTNPKWLDVHNVPKDYPTKDMPEHIAFLENGKCRKCKRTKWELIQNHGLRNYLQLVNVLGQRSGKSSSMATYASYHLHRILKFPNYATLTKTMQASTEITGTMVSLNFAKAVGVMWTPFRKIITEESKWFKDYFAKLDYYKGLYGRELYRSSTLYMSFGMKNLRFYPSGPKSSTLRGDTRIFAALDELGLFRLPSGNEEEDENSEIANADEAHKSLLNSLTTVNLAYNELLAKGYNTAPPALLMSVSSPMSQRDKVMRLLRESRSDKGKPFILGVNLPTWEVNPSMSKQTPVIANAYASNPEKAERDFGANPPLVHSRFIAPEQIQEGVFINGINSHELAYHIDQPGLVYGKLKQKRSFKYPSVVAMDAGSVNNSFAVAAGHFDFDQQKTVVTTLLECVPVEGRRIDFNLLYQYVILPLMQDTWAVGLCADQWQSIDILHRGKADMGNNPSGKPKTLSTQYSLKRNDFNNFRAMLDNKSILFPTVKGEAMQYIIDGRVEDYKKEMKDRPVDHTALQMITIRDLGETRCPDKGEGFTDDILRAVVLLVSKIHHPKIMERLVEARPWVNAAARMAAPRPVYVSRGGTMARAMGLQSGLR